MEVDLDCSIDRAWQPVRAAALGKERPSDAVARSWSDCVGQLADLFAGRIGHQAVAERFHIPADYARFMARIGGGWTWGTPLDQSLWDAQKVAQRTAADFRSFVTDRKGLEDDKPQDDGLWLSIGWYSDKHATLLCCDRTHSHYGAVVDHHDGHPWLNGVDDFYLTVEDRSFVAWLTAQAARLTRRCT